MSTIKANRIENLTTTNGGISINNSGNVGVGTSSPSSLLHLAANAPYITFEDVDNNQDWQLQATAWFALRNQTTSSELLRVNSSGDVGIGTTSPAAKLHLADSSPLARFEDTDLTATYGQIGQLGSAFYFDSRSNTANGQFIFRGTGGGVTTEFARINSSGNVGIGTTSPAGPLHVQKNSNSPGGAIQVWGADTGANLRNVSLLAPETDSSSAPFTFFTNNSWNFRVDSTDALTINDSGNVGIGNTSPATSLEVGASGSSIQLTGADLKFTRNTSYIQHTGTTRLTVRDTDNSEYIVFDYNSGNNRIAIGSKDYTRFRTGSSLTERMRIHSGGQVTVGTTSINPGIDNTIVGASINNGYISASRNNPVAYFSRPSTDGTLVFFAHAGTNEGSIGVSGTTINYNGAHLSRWSQLAGGAERTEILRGSVLSNLDEMCEWGEEDNEQLNRMKVSDVEGDVNVAGVFQSWDDDDDTYTNDFYCAMTGDFVIRIAQGTTVARGDLLMSAGDGTAKPQDDDIVRSKTIAKVTSTVVSETYTDGSYCVPCVLMAC